MGKKRRNTAKTGDVALYKSRDSLSSAAPKKDKDNMYDEVDRYNNAKDDLQDDMLRFNQTNNEDDSEDGDDHVENVFDLGLNDDDDESDSDDSEDDSLPRDADSDDADSHSDNDSAADATDESSLDDDMEIPEKTDILNWGSKKKDYYHGDTADLEIGQDVEDALDEEVGAREVLKTRLEGMTEDDFMLENDDDDDDDDSDHDASDESQDGKATKSDRGIETISTLSSSKRKHNLIKLSKRDKTKLMDRTHPELMPLINHFREEAIRPCVDETMVVANAMLKNGDNAEAVGSNTAGLQYLITKAMLQTSTALNVCQYLMIKAQNAAEAADIEANDDFMGVMGPGTGAGQDEDTIKNHPVINRLNQLNHLADKLRTSVEEKGTGLKDQMSNLVKATSLMVDDENADADADTDAAAVDSDNENQQVDQNDTDDAEMKELASDMDNDASSSSSDEDDEDATAAERRVMNEARYALRAQDDMDDEDDEETDRSSKKRRTRRAVPAFSDYGDDDNDDNEADLNKAAQSLAATVNTITQRSKSKKSNAAPEVETDENADRFKRGLEMMEAELGAGSDDDDDDNDDAGDMDNQDADLDDGDLDSDDDFYAQIKQKSKEKKEYKKNLYAVAPKYPGLDAEIEGERSIGNQILKNRGLVAHKAKINRNPRVKKREQYRKALIRRKGAVREIRTDEGHKYGGEETGIKSGLSRSRKL